MIITSVVLLLVAFVLLVAGSLQGSPVMLGVSLGAALAGGLSLVAGNAAARRMAVARGVPVESILAARVRRPGSEPAPANGAGEPPIDGYDDMSAMEVTRLVSSGAVPETDLSEMLVYEASHRKRRAVLTALLDAVGPDNPAAKRTGKPKRRGPPDEQALEEEETRRVGARRQRPGGVAADDQEGG